MIHFVVGATNEPHQHVRIVTFRTWSAVITRCIIFYPFQDAIEKLGDSVMFF